MGIGGQRIRVQGQRGLGMLGSKGYRRVEDIGVWVQRVLWAWGGIGVQKIGVQGYGEVQGYRSWGIGVWGGIGVQKLGYRGMGRYRGIEDRGIGVWGGIGVQKLGCRGMGRYRGIEDRGIGVWGGIGVQKLGYRGMGRYRGIEVGVQGYGEVQGNRSWGIGVWGGIGEQKSGYRGMGRYRGIKDQGIGVWGAIGVQKLGYRGIGRYRGIEVGVQVYGEVQGYRGAVLASCWTRWAPSSPYCIHFRGGGGLNSSQACVFPMLAKNSVSFYFSRPVVQQAPKANAFMLFVPYI